jgi:small GTP-binding protein
MREATFKFITIGESSVGKTCMIMRYTEDTFTDLFLTTVGVDFKVIDRELDGRRIRIQVWDTAGQEQFHTITKSYFRGAHGVILVFDVTSRVTLDRTHAWMDSIRETASDNIDIILVGNKIDRDGRVVSEEEGKALGREYGVPYFETSAKTGDNIHLAFDTLTRAVVTRRASEPPPKMKQVQVDGTTPPPDGRNCC